jgi:hypothetical protein
MKRTLVGEAIITIGREGIEEGIEVGIGEGTGAGIEVETIGTLIQRNRATRVQIIDSVSPKTKVHTNQTSKKSPDSTKTRTTISGTTTTATTTIAITINSQGVTGDTNHK